MGALTCSGPKSRAVRQEKISCEILKRAIPLQKFMILSREHSLDWDRVTWESVHCGVMTVVWGPAGRVESSAAELTLKLF